MDILRYAKLAPLIPKKLSDLSSDELGLAAEVFDVQVEVTDELRSAFLALLQGKDIDTVADLVQSPESIHQIISLFKKKQDPTVPEERLVRCPHCSGFFLIKS